jgi:thiamine biosynthesis protein ThiI
MTQESLRKSALGEAVLLRYGELFLKSEPVKRQFITALLRNVGNALDAAGLDYRFEVHRGRILVYGDHPGEIARVTSRVFGLVDVAVSIVTAPDPAAVTRAAVALAATHLRAEGRFAIRARRQGVEGVNSQQLAARVGEAVMQAVPGVVVDLESPDYEIFVELRQFGGLVYDTRVPAPGGLPLGTQGKVLALLSAGIDSPVAAWLMMKRGCAVEALHVHTGRFAGRDTLETALRHLAALSRWCAGSPLRLHMIDAGDFYEAIVQDAEPRLRCVLCKRFMVKAASAMALRDGYLAICMGDSLGQVASQTLVNLAVVSEASAVPILRPLVAFDKEETIALAREIGTFEQAQGDLSCAAVPRRPATTSRLDILHAREGRLDVDTFIAGAIAHSRVFTVENGDVNPEDQKSF